MFHGVASSSILMEGSSLRVLEKLVYSFCSTNMIPHSLFLTHNLFIRLHKYTTCTHGYIYTCTLYSTGNMYMWVQVYMYSTGNMHMWVQVHIHINRNRRGPSFWFWSRAPEQSAGHSKENALFRLFLFHLECGPGGSLEDLPHSLLALG